MVLTGFWRCHDSVVSKMYSPSQTTPRDRSRSNADDALTWADAYLTRWYACQGAPLQGGGLWFETHFHSF